MSNSISFINPGVLDLRCIKQFGVSVKPMTDNPLGQFGSGSKYLIAVFLRLNHTIELYLGKDRYKFITRPVDIRGKEFNSVFMVRPDGVEEEMPFNTHLGFQWEPWQAYREGHSNALDEGGFTTNTPYTPKDNQTAFVITGQEIAECYGDRDSIFLSPSRHLISATDNMQVFSGTSNYAYYRGVRVFKLPYASMFTYNMKSMPGGLTEDRTMKSPSDLDYRMAQAIASSENEDYLHKVLVAPKFTFEEHSYGYGFTPSKVFLKVVNELLKEGKLGLLTNIANSCFRIVNKTVPMPDPIQPTRIQQIQLDRAIAFCKKCGWDVDRYPVMVIPRAHAGVEAVAANGKIYLTSTLFDKGTKTVATALLEEWIHLRHGMADHTRELQTYLFEQMVSLSEQLAGEPI